VSTPAVEEILGQLPIPQLAAQLGVDEPTAARTAAAAIPSLIGGLAYNADQGQAQVIADALAEHGSGDLLDSGQVDLDRVDAEDGAKIVHHIFGEQSTQLAHAVGQRTGTDASLVSSLLPVLAPVVLAYAGKKLGLATPAGGGGVLGDFLGSILSGQPATVSDTTSETPAERGTSSDSGAEAGTASDSASAAGPSNSATGTEEQRPQSGGSIVDEILGGLFGKR
jgi:hypothetical protein